MFDHTGSEASNVTKQALNKITRRAATRRSTLANGKTNGIAFRLRGALCGDKPDTPSARVAIAQFKFPI
jgi:hypothetical protein